MSVRASDLAVCAFFSVLPSVSACVAILQEPFLLNSPRLFSIPSLSQPQEPFTKISYLLPNPLLLNMMCDEQSTGRVVGFELIPLSELGRPRIDVLGSMSGIFR